jgi:hypothetical protein
MDETSPGQAPASSSAVPAFPVRTSLSGTPTPKDIWDKADVIGKLLGAILIPIAVAAVGFFVNAALQNRETQEKGFETAVTVLQSSSSVTPELRKWALGVFQDGTDAPPAVINELKRSPLPSNTGNFCTGPRDAGKMCGPNGAGRCTAVGTCVF